MPRQFAFAAEGVLNGPFWTFSKMGSLRFLGFLTLALYRKAWPSTLWWSETTGNGRDCRPGYRLGSLSCLFYVLVNIRKHTNQTGQRA